MVKKKSVDSKFINGLESEESHKHYINSLQKWPLYNFDSTDGECVLGKGLMYLGEGPRGLSERNSVLIEEPGGKVWARNKG